MNNSHCIPLLFLLLLTIPLFGHQPNEVSFKKNEAKLDIQLHDINSFSGQNLQKITPHNSKITFLTEKDTIRNRKKRQAGKKPKTTPKTTTTKKPVNTLDKIKKNILKDINKKRQLHNVSSLIEDAKFDQDAQQFADFLAGGMGYPPAENRTIAELSYQPLISEWQNPVDFWYDYSKKYDANAYGSRYFAYKFIQLIWKGSKRIGCGASENSYRRMVICLIWPKYTSENIDLSKFKPKKNF